MLKRRVKKTWNGRNGGVRPILLLVVALMTKMVQEIGKVDGIVNKWEAVGIRPWGREEGREG